MFALVHVNSQHLATLEHKLPAEQVVLVLHLQGWGETPFISFPLVSKSYSSKELKKSQTHLKLLLASKNCDFRNIFLCICFPESFLSILKIDVFISSETWQKWPHLFKIASDILISSDNSRHSSYWNISWGNTTWLGNTITDLL